MVDRQVMSEDRPAALVNSSQPVRLIIIISVDFAVGKMRSVPSAAIRPSSM